jgi:hypothetical protein
LEGSARVFVFVENCGNGRFVVSLDSLNFLAVEEKDEGWGCSDLMGGGITWAGCAFNGAESNGRIFRWQGIPPWLGGPARTTIWI